MGSASESFEQERRVGRYQQYVEQFQRDLRAKLRAALPSADLKFNGLDVTVGFPDLGLGIRVEAVGKGLIMPVNRVRVRLGETLKGPQGELREEFRSTKKTEQVSLDRVVAAVVIKYQAVEPLYRLRKTAKREIWQILGMDPGEIENTRQVQHQGRDLVAGVQWSDYRHEGVVTDCCVEFVLREWVDPRVGYVRKLTWEFPLDEVVNVVKFRQQLQEGMEKWDQEDEQKLKQEVQKQSNAAIVTQLQKDFQEVDCVSLEATPDSFRTVVWLKNETEIRALLEWLRNRQQSGKEG
jgi:hypothetical protein